MRFSASQPRSRHDTVQHNKLLSREQNELITRVGPGTPMGTVLRAYWLPVLLSEEVQADGDPLRVRLLGEDLTAFRDSLGATQLNQAI